MSHSVQSVKLRTAYTDLLQLTQRGADFREALAHVKQWHGLENSIELELRYAAEVHLIDRTDEVMNDLASEIEELVTATYKPTLLGTFKSWIGLKKVC